MLPTRQDNFIFNVLQIDLYNMKTRYIRYRTCTSSQDFTRISFYHHTNNSLIFQIDFTYNFYYMNQCIILFSGYKKAVAKISEHRSGKFNLE